MKTIYITIALAFISIQLSAQEKMKVELKSGQTVEYNVEDVNRVYFDATNVAGVINVSPTSFSMYYDDTKQLSAPGATSWTTSNDFVAAVDNNGLVTGRHIGTTQITASNGTSSDICNITINPKYTMYDTPLLKWGYSSAMIRANETHNVASEPTEKTSYYDYSFGSTKCIVAYSFKNDVLSGVIVFMPYSSALLLKTSYFITERYQPYANDGNDYYFIDAMKAKDAKTVVMHSLKTTGRDYVDVYYLDGSILNSSSSRARSLEDIDNIQTIREQAMKLLETF